MQKNFIFIFIVLSTILFINVLPSPLANDIQNSELNSLNSLFITVRGREFVDTKGRQIILHGTNISEKSKSLNYLSWHGPEEFAMMREWGFNLIRLVIMWDGVEPKPGVYDEKYLSGIDKRIQWAKENGIFVMLDMHQDLYSAKFGGDGAPEWAIIDNGQPHIPGSNWGMTYYTSPAVQAAFDNFWANTPASDGIGLQDHFARAWQYIAKRYRDEPTVIGYDLFNEPFPGTDAVTALFFKLQDMVKSLNDVSTRKYNLFEVMNYITDPDSSESKEIIGKILDNFDIFKAFVDGGIDISTAFDSNILVPFYNRVTQAIRQVDKNHIIFIETNILGNFGTPTGLSPVIGLNNSRDPLQAFAPHCYDMLTDVAKEANTRSDNIELILNRHFTTVKNLGIPTIIGEWGGLYEKSNAISAAQIVVDGIEDHLFGDAYWSYGSSAEMNDAPYFLTILRPYPAATAGELLYYKSDMEKGTFTCSWKEDPNISSPTHIYIPNQWFPEGYEVNLEPFIEGWSFKPTSPGSSNGYLIVPTSGKRIDRIIKVTALKSPVMIKLKPGWNFFSFPVNKCFYKGKPPTDQPANVELVNIEDLGFKTMADWFNSTIISEKKLDKVWEILIGPNGTIVNSVSSLANNISHISPCTGYQVKIKKDAGDVYLSIKGPIFEPKNPIKLSKGWNMIGYPIRTGYYGSGIPPTGMELDKWVKVDKPVAKHVFSSIEGKYSMIFGYNGFYCPEFPPELNSLRYIAPGYAYWINMKEPAKLIYSP